MKKPYKIFMSPLDEFNNITLENNAAYFYKKDHPDVTIVINTVKKFEPICTYADLVHTRDDFNILNWGLYPDQYSDTNSLSFLQGKFPHMNPHHYWITYCTSSKILNIERDNYKFAVPSKNMYDKYYNQRPYVVVNGRNLPNPITAGCNISMKYCIDTLMENNIKVINTTMYSPGYSYDKENYIENDCIDENCKTGDYNELLAIFANANMVFATGNCGGIGQHILSYSNMCLCCTAANRWVDEVNMGYDNNVTIYDARKKVSLFHTDRFIHELYKKDDILLMAFMNPPKLDTFFDNTIVSEEKYCDDTVNTNIHGEYIGVMPSWLKGI